MQVLTNIDEIRAALGPDYEYLLEFDPAPEQRRLTRKFRCSLVKQNLWYCAICGLSTSESKLEIHHIHHVASGARTEAENLLPLCQSSEPRFGCHRLVHLGCASADELSSALQMWLKGKFSADLRGKMERRLENRRKENYFQFLIDDGQYDNAAKHARKQQKTSAGEEALRWRIKARIEVNRHKGGKNDLGKAIRAWELLENEVVESSPLVSYFYYEGGYINMLMGRHSSAVQYFQRSLAAIESSTHPSQENEGMWLGSVALIVQTMVASGGPSADWCTIDDLVGRAIRLIKQSSADNDTRHRWVDNWRWHQVRLWLVKGNKKRCRAALKVAQEHGEALTLEDKHDRLGLAVRLSIEGCVDANWARTPEHGRKALKLLIRGLVLQIGHKKRYPEMVRDVLFSIASCLRLIGNESEAIRVQNVALQVRDGSSWLYPYREQNWPRLIEQNCRLDK